MRVAHGLRTLFAACVCVAFVSSHLGHVTYATASPTALDCVRSFIQASTKTWSGEISKGLPAQRVDRLSVDIAMFDGPAALVHHSPDLRRGGYDMYAVFDPDTHRVLIVEKHYTWESTSLTSATAAPCKLAAMSLSRISTDMGFSIGSTERAVTAKFGNGSILRQGDVTRHAYNAGCNGITFEVRNHRIVAVSSSTGGC